MTRLTGRLPGQGRLGVVGPSPRRDSITCSHCDGAQPHCGTVTARQYNLKPAAAAGPGGPAPAPGTGGNETPCVERSRTLVTLATRAPRVSSVPNSPKTLLRELLCSIMF